MVQYQKNNDNNYWPNVSSKSLFLCLISSRGENLLTRSTSEIGTLSEPRSTHHQLGSSSPVCAHWAPGSKFVPTFPSTAFSELPPQLQFPLCLVGFLKARFSTHVIYGDKAHINMLFWMKHEPSLRLILILVSNFCEAAPRQLFQVPKGLKEWQGVPKVCSSNFMHYNFWSKLYFYMKLLKDLYFSIKYMCSEF